MVPTHQLELPAAIIRVLDAFIGPQRPDRRQVVLKHFGLHHAMPMGHGRSGIKSHHGLSVLLVGQVAPRDVQLLPRIHQHSNTCKDGGEECGGNVLEKGLVSEGLMVLHGCRDRTPISHVPLRNKEATLEGQHGVPCFYQMYRLHINTGTYKP